MVLRLGRGGMVRAAACILSQKRLLASTQVEGTTGQQTWCKAPSMEWADPIVEQVRPCRDVSSD
jgi:hypothetical protein